MITRLFFYLTLLSAALTTLTYGAISGNHFLMYASMPAILLAMLRITLIVKLTQRFRNINIYIDTNTLKTQEDINKFNKHLKLMSNKDQNNITIYPYNDTTIDGPYPYETRDHIKDFIKLKPSNKANGHEVIKKIRSKQKQTHIIITDINFQPSANAEMIDPKQTILFWNPYSGFTKQPQ